MPVHQVSHLHHCSVWRTGNGWPLAEVIYSNKKEAVLVDWNIRHAASLAKHGIGDAGWSYCNLNPTKVKSLSDPEYFLTTVYRTDMYLPAMIS